jgi:hypothetical protein
MTEVVAKEPHPYCFAARGVNKIMNGDSKRGWEAAIGRRRRHNVTGQNQE